MQRRNDRIIREIGSEFWHQSPPLTEEYPGNEVYLLSGRTALRFIIDDICRNKEVRKVLMPSYCCDSMIIPFVQSGIEVEFYQVHRDHLDFPYENDADIIFLIDFFGYEIGENLDIARRENRKKKIIIYDATHKINGNENVEALADYSFCSYRKWFYCNYAKAVKWRGAFDHYTELGSHERYLLLRDIAAREKEKYIAGLVRDKQIFLSHFSEAEQILDRDYVGYCGNPVEADVGAIVAKRRENAAILIRELMEIPQVCLWRDRIGPNDAPLFVPILVAPEVRSNLRNHLIEEQIYCPIHWPKSSYHEVFEELYDMELSLVCDQRYNSIDMKRMVQAIKGFFRG